MKRLLLLAVAFAPLGVLRAQTEAPKTSGFAPLEYFDAKCSRCHGPNGTFYGPTFGKNLKDVEAMRKAVKDMCDGPGGAPLEGANLDTLNDFHLDLRDGKPYAVAVEFKDNLLSGEATPESKITIESGTAILEAKLEGTKWTVTAPTDFVWKGAKLHALKGDAESTVEL